MNKDEAYELLLSFLGQFSNIIILKEFIEDFSDILNNEAKGTEDKLLTSLVTLLRQVKEYGYKIVTVNGHEQLKNYNSLISLHLKGKTYNVRILATIREGNMYFLSAFNKRSGKRMSDYGSYAKIAIRRLKDMDD